MSKLLAALCLLLAGQACTYRAWYEGFQERERQACYRSPSRDDIQKCLDRVNSVTYDDYRRGLEDPNRRLAQ